MNGWVKVCGVSDFGNLSWYSFFFYYALDRGGVSCGVCVTDCVGVGGGVEVSLG